MRNWVWRYYVRPRSNRRKSNVHKFQLIFCGNCWRSTSVCPDAREIDITLPQHLLVNSFLAHRVLPRGWTTPRAISQKKLLRGPISQLKCMFSGFLELKFHIPTCHMNSLLAAHRTTSQHTSNKGSIV